ncbi:type II secretion system F family protein [Verrucomicrobiales bacterium BCK34]|nr:type II secretion system F family protein [Verrucomicrobiales bacterium BCK34]
MKKDQSVEVELSPAQAALAASNEAAVSSSHHAAPKKAPLFSAARSPQRYPFKELIKLCRGMAAMLRANINTSDAIKYYMTGHPNPFVRETLGIVRAHLETGLPVYTAFAKTKKFDNKFVSLIRAGADTGQLDGAFHSIAHRLKKEAEFKAKMRKATLLPCFIMLALVGLFIVAQLKIVPQVEGMIKEVGQEPDALSAFFFKLSHITQNLWPFVVAAIIGAGCAFIFSEKTRNHVIVFMMSKWRMLRKLIMGMRQLLFLGSMEMLHSNGIPLAKSVEISAESLKGTPMYDELITAGKRYVETGLPFSEAVRKFTSCDAQVSHLMAIGEHSSSLGQQLELLTEMYEEEVEQVVADFSQVVNLIALFFTAILLTVVFISAFLPIFLMGPKMMNGQGL